MIYDIEVTQQDIKRAIKLGFPPSQNCPISLALKRTLKRKDVATGWGDALIGGTEVRLPRSAQKFAESFDDLQRRPDCIPFRFKLNIKEPPQRGKRSPK